MFAIGCATHALLHTLSLPSPKQLSVPALIGIIFVFGFAYGAVMGTFSGIGYDRHPQILISACKVPFLLLASYSLTLPPFFVINTLYGVREDFPTVLRSLFATQAGFSVILASFAPFTILWYVSWGNYTAAILFNGVVFAAASLCTILFLFRFYSPLIVHNPIHRKLLYGWLGLYVFVGIQMGWLLRPFIGSPDRPLELIRKDTWGNAYIEIWVLFGQLWEQL